VKLHPERQSKKKNSKRNGELKRRSRKISTS
jgi:hypothetical protein